MWVEVTGELIPHVFATDALVVHPIGHAVDRNFNISYVGVKVVFRVPSPCCVGVDEQKQDSLERLALGVHPKVEAGVRASCDGHHHFTHDEVVRELLATAVRAERLVGQSLASMTSYSSWMFSNLYPSLLGSEPFTTWPAGASVSSKTKSL